jgi:tight adherence protein B
MTIIAVLVFFGVAITLTTLVLAAGDARSCRSRLRSRARSLRARQSGGRDMHGQYRPTPISLKKAEPRSLPMIEELARRILPRQAVLRERLARTGCTLTIGTYLVICLGSTLGLFVTVSVGFHFPLAVAVPVALAGGLSLPHMATGVLAKRNSARFLAILPEAIDLIVRGLKSGLPVTESIAAVAREMAQPLAGEFRRVTDSVRFGRPLEEVLWESARRMNIPELNFFVISISIQRETGGNLAETLANLSDILRRRQQMCLKVKAMSAEAKASAWILGSMPFGMLALVYVSNPSYVATLFTDPRGIMMLGAGLVSLAIAAVVITKLIRFEI